ncbi:hypothetical protein [Wohlfahrtiimonas larvae]|uniref:Uncharacterized protein n=1 Tax=Wohlfahrtiimonas larvae TaxID=1157986 RepID=A0ABP9MW67_9GAMM|nr:hypothetical protein [Wohlfahrtiimonas larvae]
MKLLIILFLIVTHLNIVFGEILDKGVACVSPQKSDGSYNKIYRLRYVIVSGEYINEGTKSQNYNPNVNYAITEWPNGEFSVFGIAYDSELLPVDMIRNDEMGSVYKIKKAYTLQCS